MILEPIQHINIPIQSLCNCESAFTVGLITGGIYTAFIIFVIAMIYIMYRTMKKLSVKEEPKEKPDEEMPEYNFYNGEET